MEESNFKQLKLEKSSNIKEAYYSEKDKQLKIVFHSGYTYLYYDISPKTIKYGQDSNFSTGEFFYKYIRNRKYEKL